eukprot:4546891-Karenia_brevis.AAC.1
MAKFPHIRGCVVTVARAYAKQGFPGLYHEGLDLSTLEPAPPPGSEGRSPWKQNDHPKGPVGLLLQNIHMLGAALDVS